ncbi:MAG: leucyl aminopeptidase [Arachnia propionica]|nr:MAG: leucyl aminopeptidase [Arachnia propionica]
MNPDSKLQLTKSISPDVDVVVVGLVAAAEATSLVGGLPELDQAYAERYGMGVFDLATSLGAEPKLESVCVLPQASPRVLVVGLGEADVSCDQLRRAVGTAARAIAALPDAAELQVALSLELADPELAQAAAEGALLGAHGIRKITADQAKDAIATVQVLDAGHGELQQALHTAEAVASAVATARDWVNMPPNLLFPESFTKHAAELLKPLPVKVTVLDEKELAKGGYGGILAVGGGSSRGPRLLQAHYQPRNATSHLALVGKGITFDSGGINLKPAEGMFTMKLDMSGAAAVINAIGAIAALELPIEVTAYAALAENLPSSTAYRPSDVLTMYGGTTVENANTDAEGRLVLADALSRAGEDNPDLIVDVATLTGACMIALGTRVCGLMASDDATADLLLDSAEMAGEELWQLPITEAFRDSLKSDIADVRSGGKNRYGSASVAASFLQRFVPADMPWAHLDIAGPSFNEEAPHGHVPTGGTGVAVATLVALARRLSE